MKIKRARTTVTMHQQTEDGVSYYDILDGSAEPTAALFLTRQQWQDFGQPAMLHLEISTEAPADALPDPSFAGTQVDGAMQVGRGHERVMEVSPKLVDTEMRLT